MLFRTQPQRGSRTQYPAVKPELITASRSPACQRLILADARLGLWLHPRLGLHLYLVVDFLYALDALCNVGSDALESAVFEVPGQRDDAVLGRHVDIRVL